MNALQTQVGGDHYSKLAIQPVEYITKNRLGYAEGSVIKYVTRHRSKGGAEDIRKAIHFLNLILELEYKEPRENKDECQAKFVQCVTHNSTLAIMSTHGGKPQAMNKGDLKHWSEGTACQSCKAAASLALVELTKP